MVPLASVLVFNRFEDNMRQAFSIRKTWTTFRKKHRNVEALDRAARNSFLKARSLKHDFKAKMMLTANRKTAAELASLQKLGRQLIANEVCQYDRNDQIFLTALGIEFIEGAQGVINGTISNPQRLGELVRQAIDWIEDDLDLKAYEAWSRKSGIIGLE